MMADIVAAGRQHAADLARLQDLADDGLPRLFWERDMRPGETIWDAGARSFGPDEIRRHVRVALAGGCVAGAAMSYPMKEPGPPAFPDVAPLATLKARHSGLWYVDFIAVYPDSRGKGLARQLLEDARQRAAKVEALQMFLIVLERNAAARAFYERLGWTESARIRLEPVRWPDLAQDAIALTKPV